MLETVKRELQRPAGSPSFMILSVIERSSAILAGRKREAPFCIIITATTKIAERYSEIIVARATPLTAISQTITKKRLRSTLSIPEPARIYRALFESPRERSTDEPKLYITLAGIPMQRMCM